MKRAADIMHTPAPSVAPDVSVKDLHHRLVDDHLDGVCVVDDGKLVGVVTAMDLVYRERKVHLPTFFFFLDAVLPSANPQDTYEEVLKMAGSKVGDLATHDVITVGPDTAVDEMATLMVDKHLTVLPVLDGGELVGMVTKDDVLRASLGSA